MAAVRRGSTAGATRRRRTSECGAGSADRDHDGNDDALGHGIGLGRADAESEHGGGREDLTAYLPAELIIKIMGHMTAADVVAASVTCKRWRDLAQCEDVWRAIFLRTFRTQPILRIDRFSWRREVLRRCWRERLWNDGPVERTAIDATVGPIDSFVVDNEGDDLRVICASSHSGLISVLRSRDPQAPFKDRFVLNGQGARSVIEMMEVAHLDVSAMSIVAVHQDAGVVIHRCNEKPSRSSPSARDWTPTAIPVTDGMDSAIWAVAPDHTLIATVSHGCLRLLHPHVSVRRVATTLITLNALDSAVTHLAILPSSRTVVAGTATGVVAAWAPDGQALGVLFRPSQTDGVRGPALVFLQSAIATPRGSKAAASVDGGAAATCALAGFADGSLVVVSTAGPAADVTTTTTTTTTMVLQGGAARPTKAILAAASGLVLAGYADGTVLLWRLATSRADTDVGANAIASVWPTRLYRKHTAAIRALTFNDSVVVAANSDGTVCIWDMQTTRCLRELSSSKAASRRSRSGRRREPSAATAIEAVELVGGRILVAEGHEVVSYAFSEPPPPRAVTPDSAGSRPGSATGTPRASPSASPARLGSAGPRRPSSRSASKGWDAGLRDEADLARTQLAAEGARRQRQRRFSEELTLPGLTDDEMLAFALSLSLEEAAAAAIPLSSADNSLLSTSTASYSSTDSAASNTSGSSGDEGANDDDDDDDDNDGAPTPRRDWANISLSFGGGAGRSSWRAFGSL